MALVGTLANPYGWRMWQFLMTTVGFGRAEITDWQPLYRLGAGYVALWVVLSLAAIVGIMHAWRARTWELRRLAVVAMLAVASFQVGRLEAFFAIAVGTAAWSRHRSRSECVAKTIRCSSGSAKRVRDSFCDRHRRCTHRRWCGRIGEQSHVRAHGSGSLRA